MPSLMQGLARARDLLLQPPLETPSAVRLFVGMPVQMCQLSHHMPSCVPRVSTSIHVWNFTCAHTCPRSLQLVWDRRLSDRSCIHTTMEPLTPVPRLPTPLHLLAAAHVPAGEGEDGAYQDFSPYATAGTAQGICHMAAEFFACQHGRKHLANPPLCRRRAICLPRGRVRFVIPATSVSESSPRCSWL